MENVEKLTKTLIFRHFSYRQPYKFSDKILLDDNMTLYWKKKSFEKYLLWEENISFTGFKFFIF